MGFNKKQKEEKEIFTEPKLTTYELQSLEAEYKEAGGRMKFLAKKKAIRLYENGAFSVIMNPDGSIPYTEWSKKITQLEEYIEKKKYLENLEIYKQTGEWVESESMKKLKESFKKLSNSKAISGD